MTAHVFLSHDHRDSDLARAIAHTLTRVSLRQVVVWYSSDLAGSGGIPPGSVWLDKIRSRLADSTCILALITPRSRTNPWVTFEAGFGASNPNCEVIPLCFEVAISEVPFPLGMYQCFQLSDYDSLATFAARLMARLNIGFDEEMAMPVLTEAISAFSQTGAAPDEAQTARELVDVEDLARRVTDHIDWRLMRMSDAALNTHGSYQFAVHIAFPNHESTQFVEIDSEADLGQVMDNIYFMLPDEIHPYSYLQEWALRDRRSGLYLVVREVQSRVPASAIFAPDTDWEAIPLDEPYCATTSASRARLVR